MVSNIVHIVGDSSIGITIHDLVNRRYHEYQYGINSSIQPLSIRKPVVLAFDPSKSNTGLVVGDLGGTILYLIQISGAGSRISNEAFCALLRAFLAAIFDGVTISVFAQEKPILPKTGYRSMLYLNEIRTNLNNISREHFHVDPIEISNSVWKTAILPSSFRNRGKPKGSWRWLTQMYPEWSFLKDDITDAICIYLYINKTDLGKRAVYCSEHESCDNKEILLVEENDVNQGAMTRFKFNPDFSINENASFFANRRAGIGFSLIPKDKLRIDDLYQYPSRLTRNSDPDRIFMLVRRS